MVEHRLVELDGSLGEGGGQILRTSLSLSMVTGLPFRIERIRARRSRPGLLRQHLSAVEAASKMCGADVRGAEPGGLDLTFVPGSAKAGHVEISIGTAGSTTLVAQTVLPAMLSVNGACNLAVEGGTHNPASPPAEFLEATFLPVLEAMGAKAQVVLERPGFYPKGGGRLRVETAAPAIWRGCDLIERADIGERRAVATVAGLPRRIALEELEVIQDRLGLEAHELEVRELDRAACPGNVVQVYLGSTSLTEVFTAFGRRGVPANQVGSEVAREAELYLASGAPVGPYLADQLILPMGLAGRGEFRTTEPTLHTRTNMQVVERFLPVHFRVEPDRMGTTRISVEPRAQ